MPVKSVWRSIEEKEDVPRARGREIPLIQEQDPGNTMSSKSKTEGGVIKYQRRAKALRLLTELIDGNWVNTLR